MIFYVYLLFIQNKLDVACCVFILQCGVWRSVHIDDLYTENMNMPSIQEMQGKSVAGLFSNAVIESVKVATDQGLAVEQ